MYTTDYIMIDTQKDRNLIWGPVKEQKLGITFLKKKINKVKQNFELKRNLKECQVS